MAAEGVMRVWNVNMGLPPVIHIVFGALLLLSAGLPKMAAQYEYGSDPCEYVGYYAYQPYSDYNECLKSFPYNSEQAKSTLNTVWKMLVNIYPYTNLAIKAPDQRLYSRTRLRYELLRIQKTTYVNDFQFHRDLTKTIGSLNDGHTKWISNCYEGSAYVFTPFPMVQVYDSTTKASVVKIAPIAAFELLYDAGFSYIFKKAREAMNITSILAYAGAEVEEIDGLPTMDYIIRRAQRVGNFRHQQTRINSLFARPSSYGGVGSGIYLGELMNPSVLPENDTLTLKLRKIGSDTSDTLIVPYLVDYEGSYSVSNSSTFYASNCKATSDSFLDSSAKGTKGNPNSKPFSPYSIPWEKPQMLPPGKTKKLNAMKMGQKGPPRVFSSPADFLQVYLLDDLETAVLTIPDFLGPSTYYSTDTDLKFEIQSAYELIRNTNASRLIIDLSNNLGGYASLPSYFTQILFQTANDTSFPLQYKASGFAKDAYRRASSKQFTTASSYDYRNFADVDGNDFNSSSEFFVPLLNKTQNGLTEPFSSLFKLPSSISYYDFSLYGPIFSDGRSIMLLSNGLCYSSCAAFTAQMRLYNVTLVTIGGRQGGGNFSFADGYSGFVDTFSNFYKSNVYDLSLELNPKAPKPLPVQGTLTFTAAQSYGPESSTIPQEFVYVPGDFKLRYTDKNVFSLPAVWEEAALLFPK